MEALNALAEIALELGEYGRAAALAREAGALAEEIGSEDDGAVAQRLAGLAAAALGEPFEQQLDASIRRFERAKDRFELGRSWAAYGAALAARGDHEAARGYLILARDAFIAIGAAGELRRLSPATHARICDWAEAAAGIRGFGHVKARNLEAARQRMAEIEASLDAPAPAPAPAMAAE